MTQNHRHYEDNFMTFECETTKYYSKSNAIPKCPPSPPRTHTMHAFKRLHFIQFCNFVCFKQFNYLNKLKFNFSALQLLKIGLMVWKATTKNYASDVKSSKIFLRFLTTIERKKHFNESRKKLSNLKLKQKFKRIINTHSKHTLN